MSHIYIPTKSAEDWSGLLAKSGQWSTGYSAKTVAHSWEEASDFPPEISKLFATSEDANLQQVELLLAIPEHKVSLPPSQGHPSQNDVFALGKAANRKLITIAVEAKVSEPFGPTVVEWISEPTPGKEERLDFLQSKLQLTGKEISQIRYQLMHRLASAILEADRFNAAYAVMVVQSFSEKNEWFEDFSAFVGLYGQTAAAGKMTRLYQDAELSVLAGWAKGDPKYLKA